MKEIFFLTTFIFITGIFAGCGRTVSEVTDVATGSKFVNAKKQSDVEIAKVNAKKAYENYVMLHPDDDLANGPCVAEELMPDWVADIAHSPRQAVDNLAENQCQSFRNGTAHHFVELDPGGNVIRAE